MKIHFENFKKLANSFGFDITLQEIVADEYEDLPGFFYIELQKDIGEVIHYITIRPQYYRINDYSFNYYKFDCGNGNFTEDLDALGYSTTDNKIFTREENGKTVERTVMEIWSKLPTVLLAFNDIKPNYETITTTPFVLVEKFMKNNFNE